MPVSSDLVQIAIVQETAYGVIPTDPDWLVLPITSEGVVATPETTLSALLNPHRQVSDSILVNMSAEGDVNAEMVVCEAFKLILASAISNELVQMEVGTFPPIVPGKDPANAEFGKIGKDLISFAIERRIPAPTYTDDVPVYEYQRITGCVVNTLSITSSPSEPISWSAGLIGKDYLTDSSLFLGSDYVEPNDITVLRSPDVLVLGIDDEAIDARCFGDFGININNNVRGIQCIGTLGNRHTVLGRCEIDLSATIHFATNDLLDRLLAQSEHSLEFRIEAAQATATHIAMFGMDFTRMKISADAVVAGGTNTDVVNDMTMTAIYDDTVNVETTVTVTVGDGALAV
ncbi:MAG: hypothetical protein DRJ15_16525 [Bacteroidetes bacterium]|nr:MAG: hypothetical protein DRJ15_16525 [Bacteroidota bacterium]